MSDPPHVIVVGAGFAGLATVRKLRKAGLRVTVLDKNLYSTFQPLLYQVATGGLNPGDVSYPVGGAAGRYGARYLRGELGGISTTTTCCWPPGCRPTTSAPPARPRTRSGSTPGWTRSCCAITS